MGIVTTHTEGRVVTHSSDSALPVDVVQLPARDAAVQAAPAAAPAAATTALDASGTSAVNKPGKRINQARAKAMPTTKGRKPKK